MKFDLSFQMRPVSFCWRRGQLFKPCQFSKQQVSSFIWMQVIVLSYIVFTKHELIPACLSTHSWTKFFASD